MKSLKRVEMLNAQCTVPTYKKKAEYRFPHLKVFFFQTQPTLTSAILKYTTGPIYPMSISIVHRSEPASCPLLFPLRSLILDDTSFFFLPLLSIQFFFVTLQKYPHSIRYTTYFKNKYNFISRELNQSIKRNIIKKKTL